MTAEKIDSRLASIERRQQAICDSLALILSESFTRPVSPINEEGRCRFCQMFTTHKNDCAWVESDRKWIHSICIMPPYLVALLRCSFIGRSLH